MHAYMATCIRRLTQTNLIAYTEARTHRLVSASFARRCSVQRAQVLHSRLLFKRSHYSIFRWRGAPFRRQFSKRCAFQWIPIFYFQPQRHPKHHRPLFFELVTVKLHNVRIEVLPQVPCYLRAPHRACRACGDRGAYTGCIAAQAQRWRRARTAWSM